MEQIGIIGKDTLDVKLPSETENETNISNDEAPKQRKLPFAAKLLGCTIVIGAAILASLKLLK